MSTVRVTKLECNKYFTSLIAAKHGFPTGARIQVKGIPEIPETEFLFVENSSTNSFKVCRDICAEVAKIDSEKSMIFTKQPHLIPDKHQSVELCGVDMEKNEAVKRFYDVKIIDDYSMTLRSYCNATREWHPAALPQLKEAQLRRKHCAVVLSKDFSESAPEIRRVNGLASLAPLLPSKKTLLQDWRAAIDAARKAGKLQELPNDVDGPADVDADGTPNISALHVGPCGWKDCRGIFQRHGPYQYDRAPGSVSIVYVEELKAWCMLAEVAPLYPLEMERLMMGLGDFEGAQLLYLSRGPSVVGRWESVLGPAPAPEVLVYKEVTVRQDATQQETVLLQSAVGSTVLDLLFNYTNADWRGEIFNGNVWGVSAMEALLYALMLWQQMQRCSWVCRTWHRALLPFNDLKRICYRAMQIPALPPPGAVVDLPSLPDLFEAMTSGACFWSEILMISHMPWFQGRAWPMQISEINLMSEMNEDEDHFMEGPTSKALNNYAPMFLKMVRQMLAGIPLAWRTKPYTRGLTTHNDGARFAYNDLLDFVRPEEKACHGYLRSDAQLMLLSPEGRVLLPPELSVLESLQSNGLTCRTVRRGWASTGISPRDAGEPCGMPFCGKLDDGPCHVCKADAEGRTRLGATQLSGGYALDFYDGSRKITLEIRVRLIPFFVTSKDVSLLEPIKAICPFPTDDFDSTETEDEDEDDDLDDDEPPPSPKRRLWGKQPPPAAWQ